MRKKSTKKTKIRILKATGKNRNTRFVKTLKKGLYIYSLKPKKKK